MRVVFEDNSCVPLESARFRSTFSRSRIVSSYFVNVGLCSHSCEVIQLLQCMTHFSGWVQCCTSHESSQSPALMRRAQFFQCLSPACYLWWRIISAKYIEVLLMRWFIQIIVYTLSFSVASIALVLLRCPFVSHQTGGEWNFSFVVLTAVKKTKRGTMFRGQFSLDLLLNKEILGIGHWYFCGLETRKPVELGL